MDRQLGTAHSPVNRSEVIVEVMDYDAASNRRRHSLNSSVPSPENKGTGRWGTLKLSYKTLGVVFGGLVTSPLYVYPSMPLKSPTEENYLGIYSIMFWTLTLIGVVKYAGIALKADDHGEGGTFALYSLLCRNMDIGNLSSKRIVSNSGISHANVYESSEKQSSLGKFFERNVIAKRLLLFIAILGMCMLIGDGILTPAISVLSAMEGLRAPFPSVRKSMVEALSAIVLVVLFLLQKFGTSRVSFLFSPIMALWTFSTPLVGIYSIIHYYPSIFKAISPHYIVRFFLRNGKEGWLLLGGTILCITGSEALFADLGHFNQSSIQALFTGVVVTLVMLITTILLTLVMIVIWRTPSILVALFFSVFFVMEGIYVSAVLTKIPEGGWIPFAISFIIAFIMFSWFYGRQRKLEYELTHKIDLDRLRILLSDPSVQRVPGLCFFYTNVKDGLTPVLGHYIKNMKSLHKVTIFTTLRYLLVPKVAPHERVVVNKLGLEGVYGCVIQYGYADSLDLEGDDFVSEVTDSLRAHMQQGSGFEGEISDVEEAKNSGVVHIRGKTRFNIGKNCSLFDKFMLRFYEVMHRNCRSGLPAMGVPPLPQRIEVGMLYEA
ncbi:Potassium transporter [Sarracenia purpurea var. burkii]